MSAPVALIARILLALMFVLAGLSKFGNLSGTAGYIGSKGLPLPMLLAIVVGYRARIAGLVLALFTLLASVVFHNYWALPADQQMVQQLMFMKNVSVAGGLLLLAAFGAGALSLDARRGTKG